MDSEGDEQHQAGHEYRPLTRPRKRRRRPALTGSHQHAAETGQRCHHPSHRARPAPGAGEGAPGTRAETATPRKKRSVSGATTRASRGSRWRRWATTPRTSVTATVSPRISPRRDAGGSSETVDTWPPSQPTTCTEAGTNQVASAVAAQARPSTSAARAFATVWDVICESNVTLVARRRPGRRDRIDSPAPRAPRRSASPETRDRCAPGAQRATPGSPAACR